MNPVLIDSIRGQMRGQTTERLLELWTTNDRATWSPEAFEAIGSILAERGHATLPAQNPAPAPVAPGPERPVPPEAQYWLGWLRPVLCIGIVAAAATLFYRGVRVAGAWTRSDAYGGAEQWDMFLRLVHFVGLPVLLIVASVSALRLVPWSRTALLVYAWASLAVVVAEVLSNARFVAGGFNSIVLESTVLLLVYANELAVPVILLFLLRRPPIVSLFREPRPGDANAA